MVLTETGLAKVFQRIKSFVASQLNSKASAIHTHTSSDITDLPSGYVVDSALSSSSENPVQNKVIKSALDGKLGMNTGGGIVNRSGNGQYLYCQIATITILGSYVNFPIVLEISGRGILFSTVQIVFESGKTTDPNLSKFISDSYEYFYIKKIDTSTWAVYVKYTQTWGSVTVHRVSGKGLALPSISCDFTVSDVSEFPSECIQVSSSLAYNPIQISHTMQTSGTWTLTGVVPYKPVMFYFYFETVTGSIVLPDNGAGWVVGARQINPSSYNYNAAATSGARTLWDYAGSGQSTTAYALMMPLKSTVSINVSLSGSNNVHLYAYQ